MACCLKKKKSSLTPYANVESGQAFLSWVLNFANHIDLAKERDFCWKIDFLISLKVFVQDGKNLRLDKDERNLGASQVQ